MSKEIKVYFLILNYNTSEETFRCIRTINDLENKSEDIYFDKKIVIIDNHSSDNSLENFRKAGIINCSENNNDDIRGGGVELYVMPSNIGFSKANNYGYRLIKNRNDADYIIVCNSDIEFRQKNFLLLMDEEHKTYPFDICGPDVYCPTCPNRKRHQSPTWPWEYTYWFNKVQYVRCKNLMLEKKNLVVHFGTWVLFRAMSIIQVAFFRRFRLRRRCNTSLHGSCIIVASSFIGKEENLFYPETKFYYEELLLYLRVKNNGYKTVYQPAMQVFHMQGVATSKLSSEKFRFINQNLSDSAWVYLNELKKK